MYLLELMNVFKITYNIQAHPVALIFFPTRYLKITQKFNSSKFFCQKINFFFWDNRQKYDQNYHALWRNVLNSCGKMDKTLRKHTVC